MSPTTMAEKKTSTRQKAEFSLNNIECTLGSQGSAGAYPSCQGQEAGTYCQCQKTL